MNKQIQAGSSFLAACLFAQGLIIFSFWYIGILEPELAFIQRWVGPVGFGILPISLLTVDAGILLLMEKVEWVHISFNREALLDAMETLSPYLGLLGTVISIILATLQWDLVQDAQRVFQQIMGSVGAGLGSTVYGLLIALMARVFRDLFREVEGAV